MVSDDNLLKRMKRLSTYFTITVIIIAVLVLSGWQFNIELLKHPFPESKTMNPTAAVAFIAASVSFLWLSSRRSGRMLNTGSFLAFLVFFIGALKLLSIVSGLDFQIDALLFRDKLETNRIVPIAAASFMLLGIVLLLSVTKKKTHQTATFWILMLLVCTSLFSILGYLYQVQIFYGLFTYLPMAFLAAICFLLLTLAILFSNADTKIMKDFTGKLAGSVAARRLIPAAILVPVVLGFLRMIGHWKGIFTTEFGVTILVLSIIIAFMVVIWYSVSLLNKRDLQSRLADNALRQSEEQIQNIFNAAPDAVIVIDEEGKIVKWNPKAETLLGWSEEEAIGKLLSETIIPDRYRESHAKGMQHFLKTGEGPVLGKTIEINAIKKDNTEFDVALSISPTIVNGKYLFIGFIRDITQQKRAQIQLKESEEKYSLLFNSIDEGFCIIEMIFDDQKKPVDYRFLVINASFERQTGLQDAVGKRMREFAPDHEEHWFETYGKIALTGESIRFENRAEQLHRWYDVYAFRFGEPENFQVAILFNDITARKKTEKELETVNKELEAFSYSVSHDLRAPLRIIDGYSKIVIEDYAGKMDEEGNRMLGIVTASAQKMGRLIDDLLNFSRLGRKELTLYHTDMTGMVESVINEQLSSEVNHISVKVENLEPAYCDRNLLHQVWANVISNAIKYSSQREKPVIEISSGKTAGEIIYRVKDNGVGFDMQYSGKLFGVFQRLHKTTEFEGTGVGLALVQRIITRHGGRVWAEAEVNKGATFFFSLPVLPDKIKKPIDTDEAHIQ